MHQKSRSHILGEPEASGFSAQPWSNNHLQPGSSSNSSHAQVAFSSADPAQSELNPDSSGRPERIARKVLTPVHAAELLGFDDKTIERWARNGYLPAHPVGEGRKTYWRFFEDELIEWLKARNNGSRAA